MGVVPAAHDLATDIKRVTGQPSPMFNQLPAAMSVAIIGMIGKSHIIDRLIIERKINVSNIAGKGESLFLEVVPRPFRGVGNALVICGSAKRGTVYGIYDLSAQIGVSPWHWWTDVPLEQQRVSIDKLRCGLMNAQSEVL